ncbi:MAG: hypothetical protein U0V70_00190 [Terriglobia bacterium]
MNPRESRIVDVISGIQELEYEIRWQDNVGTYQTPNRAHNIRATLYRDGFSVEPRDPRLETRTGANWKAVVRVKSYGGKNKTPFPAESAPQTRILKNEARFSFDEIAVDYLNNTNGLKQTFTLLNGTSDGSRVTIQMHVALKDLEMLIDATGQDVIFADTASGLEVLRYTGLACFDATGREIPATMNVPSEDTLVISINDLDATYPIVVDPWVQHLSMTPPTYQAGASFGFSLAYMERWRPSLGNYQGSLIVGAPYFDEGAVDQGKIFAYGPTGSGTNTSFNAMFFTAKGESAYSYFGYSLAIAQPYDFPDPGSEIVTFQTESRNLADLVVGAPGHNNRVGKVYVYYGANSESHFGADNRAADRSYVGTTVGSDFGLSVAAGDITGDGVQDLVIGAPNRAFNKWCFAANG